MKSLVITSVFFTVLITGATVLPLAQSGDKEKKEIVGNSKLYKVDIPEIRPPGDSLMIQLRKLDRNIKEAEKTLDTIQYNIDKKEDLNNIDSILYKTDTIYKKRMNFLQRVINSIKHNQ